MEVPLQLAGTPYARGVQQSTLEARAVSAVRVAVEKRLSEAEALLDDPLVQNYLDRQWEFLSVQAPGHLEETRGIAEGFGLTPRAIFDCLHLGILSPSAVVDGCSILAASISVPGPVLVKNRDYRGTHRALQRVFVHSEPNRTSGRCVVVGSLGAPGAFSSGMNSAGLAIADTRVDCPAVGVGWLRYYLMTEILWRSVTVEEAVDFIASVPHAGGGSLALADASGAVASVEFGHPHAITRSSRSGIFVHTNHYLFETHPFAMVAEPDINGSKSSLARLDALLQAAGRFTDRTRIEDLIQLFSSHEPDEASLCRHGPDDEENTISTAIFCCSQRELVYTSGNPCNGNWWRFRL